MEAHLERVARRERLAQQWAQSWLDTQSKAPGINLGEMEQSLAGMLLRWGAQYAKDESAAVLAACAREATETESAKHLSAEEVAQAVNVARNIARLEEAKWWHENGSSWRLKEQFERLAVAERAVGEKAAGEGEHS